MKFLTFLVSIFLFSFNAQCEEEVEVIEFEIEQGTGESSWNTEQTPIYATLGSTIRLINNDDIDHRLHTNGAPCGHGDKMAPGETWDCVVEREFSSKKSGPLYDHYVGPKSEVWIEIVDELPGEEAQE